MPEEYETEVARLLEERIKPNLSKSTIPLVARSIAKEIASRRPSEDSNGDEPSQEEPKGEEQPQEESNGDEQPQEESKGDEAAEESNGDEAGESPPNFEAEMHELQQELGDSWILRFSVQGESGWLTAETDDGSQRVEAPNASGLLEIVEAINEGGGREG